MVANPSNALGVRNASRMIRLLKVTGAVHVLLKTKKNLPAECVENTVIKYIKITKRG